MLIKYEAGRRPTYPHKKSPLLSEPLECEQMLFLVLRPKLLSQGSEELSELIQGQGVPLPSNISVDDNPMREYTSDVGLRKISGLEPGALEPLRLNGSVWKLHSNLLPLFAMLASQPALAIYRRDRPHSLRMAKSS